MLTNSSESINNTISECIFRISRSMRDSMLFSKKNQQLTLLQLHTLMFLKKNNNVPMNEIAKHFRISKPTATTLLDKLIEMKLAKRTTNEEDRRLIHVSLTTKGLELMKKAMDHRKKKMELMLSFLPKRDKEELLRILQILSHRLSIK